MQQAPQYDDVVADVNRFLRERLTVLDGAGVARDRLVLDPGFGFGKTLDHNLDMLRRLPEFCESGLPVLAGLSRKSMLGMITGRPVEQRLSASVTAAIIAAQRGAQILRVHDVAETRDALTVLQAVCR
jgi:dihydropteroate synthase